ncbi:hypothetical protein B0H14DRAFT_3432890 [Mycena olivaceomarginata]|nr:hypothetical protein B0H14DRAFT_3432890 [Mycena olivaceomarginata]
MLSARASTLVLAAHRPRAGARCTHPRARAHCLPPSCSLPTALTLAARTLALVACTPALIARHLLLPVAIALTPRHPRARYPPPTHLVLTIPAPHVLNDRRPGSQYPPHAPRSPPLMSTLPAAPVLNPCPMLARCSLFAPDHFYLRTRCWPSTCTYAPAAPSSQPCPICIIFFSFLLRSLSLRPLNLFRSDTYT